MSDTDVQSPTFSIEDYERMARILGIDESHIQNSQDYVNNATWLEMTFSANEVMVHLQNNDAHHHDRIDHLMHIIDRDRYVVARGVTKAIGAIDGRRWILEGRGPYSYDDDDYRREFKDAIDDIERAFDPLRKIAWDKSDCTTLPERVQAARDAAADLIRAPLGHRDMISADLFGDPRDLKIEILERRIVELESKAANSYNLCMMDYEEPNIPHIPFKAKPTLIEILVLIALVCMAIWTILGFLGMIKEPF